MVGSVGPVTSSRRSASFNGWLAGATIEVWKAWLTGMRTALIPRDCRRSIVSSTPSLEPPITAWWLLLMFATTT